MPRCRLQSIVLCGVVLAAIQGVSLSAQGQVSDLDELVDELDAERIAPWSARVEYQFWWTKGNPTPALASFSPDGTDRADAGVLGTPGATVLAGDEELDRSVRSGGRAVVETSFASAPALSMELGAIFIGDGRPSHDFFQDSPGSPILSRPFYNVVESQEDAELVAFPDVLAGSLTVHSTSEVVSPELNLRYRLPESGPVRLSVLGGYRYFRLRESLTIHESLVSIDAGGLIPLGTSTEVDDRFVARNEFHGGQLGLGFDYDYDLFTLSLLAKAALGNLQRTVDVRGSTVVTIPDLPATTYAGGLLAQPTNIGRYRSNRFAVLPELGVSGRLRLTQRIDFIAGYSVLFLNDTARSGAQVDRVVNPSQIGGEPLVGAARPRFELDSSDFWAQSLNLGLEFHW